MQTQENTTGDAINTEAVEIKEKKQPQPPAEPKEHKTFTPLTNEPLNQKSYTQGNAPFNPADANQPIPEPVFKAPPVNAGKANPSPGPGASSAAPPPKPPFNPELSSLSDSDKHKAAKHAAEMCVQTYEWLHNLANKGLTISEKKIQKLQMEGAIDLSILIPMADGNRVPMYHFLQAYNDQQKDVFVVTDEFKNEVVPLLTEIFQKKGIGLTPEQKLMLIVGKDIAGKAAIGIAMLKQRKDIINSLREMTAAIKQNGGGHAPHQSAPPPQGAGPQNDIRPDYAPPPPPPDHVANAGNDDILIPEEEIRLNYNNNLHDNSVEIIDEEVEDPLSLTSRTQSLTNPEGYAAQLRAARNKKNDTTNDTRATSKTTKQIGRPKKKR